MPTLSPELLELLADPETHEPLVLANESELAALRQAVASGTARRRGAQQVDAKFDGALLSQKKRVAYLIEDGIPNLLIDERLELADAP
jgi:uncharacterized protein YbaR (Trm112 family)